MRKLLLSLITISVLGCATMKYPVNNFDIQNNSGLTNTGFLAGSYIRSYPVILRYSAGPIFIIKLMKLNEDGTKEKHVSLHQTLDLTKEKQTFIFQVDPGKYKMTKIEVGYFEKHDDISFTVEKGKINYIGYFTIAKDASLNITSSRNDDSQKDIDLIKTKHPLLSKFEIVNRAK